MVNDSYQESNCICAFNNSQETIKATPDLLLPGVIHILNIVVANCHAIDGVLSAAATTTIAMTTSNSAEIYATQTSRRGTQFAAQTHTHR